MKKTQKNKNLLKQFIQSESFSGLLLITFTLLALGMANSPWAPIYQALPQISLANLSIQHWVNEGLMTLFFLLVGLEIKSEFLHGSLSGFSKALLPIAGALGGIIAPAIIFILINFNHPENIQGWAIPVATDIAFSLGVLSLLKNKIPRNLIIFLSAIAIADDLGAILIIAIFYTKNLSLLFCLLSLGLVFILFLFNFLKIQLTFLYLILGALLWITLFKSGINPTIAGVLLAFSLPIHLIPKLEKKLLTPINYLIIPLFVFLNAGINLSGFSLFQTFSEPLTLGILLGLFIGKPVGIFGSLFLLTKTPWFKLPKDLNLSLIFGMSLIAGIGFTMSIFITDLAFPSLLPGNAQAILDCKVGIFMGSVLSAILGVLVIHFSGIFKKSTKNQKVI